MGEDLDRGARRKACGRLVEHEQLRIGHQSARDSEDLALPAGQEPAGR